MRAYRAVGLFLCLSLLLACTARPALTPSAPLSKPSTGSAIPPPGEAVIAAVPAPVATATVPPVVTAPPAPPVPTTVALPAAAPTPVSAGSGMAVLAPVTASLPLTLTAAWPAGVPLVLGDNSPRRGGSLAHGLALTISFFWDADAMYLDGAIHDATPLVNNRRGDKIWDGDGIELALGTRSDIDPRRTSFGGGDYLVGIAAALQPSGWNWTGQGPLQGLEVITGTIPGGYRLRARLPWRNFGAFQPEAGQVMPFDLALDDGGWNANGDSSRSSQLIWHGDESFSVNPGVWGYATFAALGDQAAVVAPGGFVAPAGKATGAARPPGYAPGIRIAARTAITPVAALAFGSNIGPGQVFAPGQEALLRAAGLRTLRFAGGNGDDTQPWGMQDLEEYVAQARSLAAEPFVVVPLAGSTPGAAAALVRYARDQNYAIRYWAIGSEPNRSAADGRIAGYTVARFNQDWRAFAEAMRAADPGIILVGPEIGSYTGGPGDPVDGQGVDWMEGFLRVNGDLVSLVSFHRYPFGGSAVLGGPEPGTGQATAPQALLSNPDEWDHSIPYLRDRIRALTGRDLPIAVTEVNSDRRAAVGGQTTPDSLLNALWWADVQGRLLRQGVALVQQCCLVDTGGLGLLAESARPIYYVFRLYTHFGDRLLAVEAPSDLPAYAALAADGALTLLVVNRAETVATVPVTIDGFGAGGLAQGWLLDAAHQAEAFLSSEPASSSFVYPFPPRSVTLLRVPAR